MNFETLGDPLTSESGHRSKIASLQATLNTLYDAPTPDDARIEELERLIDAESILLDTHRVSSSQTMQPLTVQGRGVSSSLAPLLVAGAAAALLFV